jgi:SAM-dependent methyltransferase
MRQFLRYVCVMSEFAEALEAGTREHYLDAALYDHEYRARRLDVNFYRRLAQKVAQATAPEQLGEPDQPVAGAPTTRILELGCGSGRLLIPLVRDGHTAIGVDLSATMLQRCQERLHRLNARARARVQILQGDFRCLDLPGLRQPTTQRFPLIICPFNSFMHLYTREDVERCLAEVRRLLTPEGIFAFDITHPDPIWLARNPTRRFGRARRRHPTTGERLIYSVSHAYDPATQIDWIRIYYEPEPEPGDKITPRNSENRENSATRVIKLAQRLFFPAEIEALLHYNGFQILHHAGGFEEGLDGALLSIVSAEQVICARVR